MTSKVVGNRKKEKRNPPERYHSTYMYKIVQGAAERPRLLHCAFFADVLAADAAAAAIDLVS